jgi:hypothetical protein
MKTGIELIAQERQEQLEKHGWTSKHDSAHENEELISAAIYALDPCMENFKYLDVEWAHFVSKIDDKNRVDQLKIAGALIAAEIDRLQSIE